MIAEMSALDPYKVRFDLSYPYSGFAEILADRQVKIVPRDMVDQLATKPVGTGPFMFQSYTPGDRLVMVKNPDYFEPGLPKLDGVELRVIPEMSVKIAALQAGDIDAVCRTAAAGSGAAAQGQPAASCRNRGNRIMGCRRS